MENQELKDILDIIDKSNESYSFPIYIPSLEKEIYFRELSTAQQKRLIKSAIDQPLYNSVFITTSFEIISENLTDKEVNAEDLTILDKFFILLALRGNGVSDKVKVQLQSKNDSNRTYDYEFSIAKILEKAQKAVKNIKTEQVDVDPYTLHCNIPNILEEKKLEEEMRLADEEIDISSVEDLRQSVGEKFIGEICKYVSSINIADKEINLRDMSFKERIQIIEKLPAKCVDAVVKYMEKVNNEVEKITLIDKKFTVEGKKEEYEYQLTLDATFFMNSSD